MDSRLRGNDGMGGGVGVGGKIPAFAGFLAVNGGETPPICIPTLERGNEILEGDYMPPKSLAIDIAVLKYVSAKT